MSNNDLNDLLKNLIPKTDMLRDELASSGRVAQVLSKPVELSDLDDSPCRTADGVEQMVALLKEMRESSIEEARLQKRRHRQIFWLTIAVLVVTTIGVLLQMR